MERFVSALPFVGVYLAVVWIISVIITVSDKSRAKRDKRRIRERTLLLFGFLGGAVPMYITMKRIHHKTLHKKFMIGLPLIILFHIILIVFIFYLLTKQNFGV